MKSMKASSSSTANHPVGRDALNSLDIKETPEDATKSTRSDAEIKELEKNQKRKEILERYSDPSDGILGVCSIRLLEDTSFHDTHDFQKNPFTFEVPRCVAADHVTLPNKDVPINDLMVKYNQSTEMVGLGLKRKEAQAAAATKDGTVHGGPKNRPKPKTLSEKRRFLENDMLRYGDRR